MVYSGFRAKYHVDRHYTVAPAVRNTANLNKF